MTFQITKTAVPTVARAGRKPLPNPWTEHFPADSEALTVNVKAAPDSTEVNRLRRQAQQAAKAVGRSAMVQVSALPGGKTKMVVWTVDQITRTRKPVAPTEV